ncbi:MAG TPA: ATP-grasp domain-containing protein, partial [Deltaproteobacteria bacterium]|nr:ATP-grasp domain-containing protein [Deltaproteobacteria bacterium]
MNRTVSKVLVANRGEIALRVIRACRDLGIATVAAVSEADRDSLPAREADRAVCIGPARPNGSYLKVDTIVTAALGAGCDAVHPGYGFLAEQPELPETCETHGLVFIGPKADNIRRMGDKLYARRMVKALGVPVIPGSELVRDFKAAKRAASRAEYPVLLKAAVGGGGKGMKILRKAEDLKASFYEASAEALAAFGDGRVYIEHYIPDARHIEVQVLGDRFGQVVHLFERDCSVQRRYQKMIEEAPSPAVTEELRERMCRAALLIAGEMEYLSAGTVEFIFDQQKQNFYF